MSGGKLRAARVKETRASFRQRKLDEIERIKQKLRHDPPLNLLRFEADMLLREMEETTSKVGAPQLLENPHRWMAMHYWWLHESGDKEVIAEPEVAKAWGVSKKTVEKYADEHKVAAMEFVRDANADPLRPAATVLELLEMVAAGFRALDE